ncbi:MAG: tetratricopeptide repeat protein [Candidatus Binatia bacterium]
MSTLIAVVLYATVCLFLTVNGAGAQSDGADKLPMFGQPGIVRPENLKKADDEFIRNSTLRFGSRIAGSNALAAQGWTAIGARQSDVAMQRLNQAWLLNPKNYRVFWGFGALMSERGRLAEALEHLETARQLVDDPAQRVALLCDLGTVHSEYAARLPADRQLERAQHFVLANSRFTESLENDPKYAMSWREWAISLYEQERYSEAWVKVKQARENKAEPFPADFLKKLSAKMPEPK